MDISARVHSLDGRHDVTVSTGAQKKNVAIPPKSEGSGSSINGGELLCLALATCYCNDVYREAKKLGIDVSGVDVEVTAEFGAEGEPAEKIQYRVEITSTAPKQEVENLLRHTDRVAEIHNTLRSGVRVDLIGGEVHSQPLRG